jgi:hypothetical protein
MYDSYIRINFDKHRGSALSEVPTSYLSWCIAECECLDDWLRRAIVRELARRGARQAQTRTPPPPPVDWAAALGRVRKELALLHHPDRGRAPGIRAGINIALDQVAQLVEDQRS